MIRKRVFFKNVGASFNILPPAKYCFCLAQSSQIRTAFTRQDSHGMAQYEVNLTFPNRDAKKKFCDFLLNDHMSDLMQCVPDQFVEASVSDDSSDELKAVVRYYSKSQNGIDTYLNDFAPSLRDDPLKHFSKEDYTVTHRRILVEKGRVKK